MSERWMIERSIDGTWTAMPPDGYELRREIGKPNLLFFRGALVRGSWRVFFKGELIATGGRAALPAREKGTET